MVEPSRGGQVRTGSYPDVNGLVCACLLSASDVNGLVCACLLSAFFSSLPSSMADFVGLTSLALPMIVTRNISLV